MEDVHDFWHPDHWHRRHRHIITSRRHDVERALHRSDGVTGPCGQTWAWPHAPNGRQTELTFESGLTLNRDVLYAHGQRELRAALAEQIGCEIAQHGITVDAQQMTTVPGIYACGDVTKGNQIAFAVAGGAMAAMQAAHAIFYDTLPDGARSQ
ncbi:MULTISPECIES: FAD-dependent oxidoreductase [unclassified Deinococcus]|uniref:FAD-dependent oxidoreductase n=1 Tax=unclassified Deinococcus TaxID=2623546 RepID=UPI0024DE4F11|nr:FAD-dependent oxidoreductase [Deinococcus sp. 43]MDK2014044.1 FAD-dependent oxidoreductase [Deinococcus sp. 43]